MPVTVDYSRDALLTDFGKATLYDRYLLPEEGPQDLFARVSEAYGSDDNHKQRLYDYMSQLWFMPSTPILSNGGTKRGLPISCFLSEVQDDLHDIAAVQTENTFLAARGGGIGTYWSNLRGIGEKIGQVGKTSGIMPFLKVMDSQTLAIAQGNIRRGSAATYLRVDHPEIEEFIEMRRPTGGDPNRKCLNLHHGVVIPDAFMRAVEQDAPWDLVSPHTGETIETVDARDLWIRILTARVETGEPYLLFIDKVNKHNPMHLKQKGLDVKTSNLCVAPETEILTRTGHVQIQHLENKEVEVWNGEEWSSVTVRKTGTEQKLITVTFSNGKTLECTPYHKFYVQRGYRKNQIEEVRAADLSIGDKLIKFDLPVIEGTEGLSKAHVQREARAFVKITGVYDEDRVDDTYCFTEPKRGMGVFNGVLTGNCSEITLPTSVERTAVCCLSSLNLEKYDEWQGNYQFVYDVMLMLDNVLEDFIQKADPRTHAKAIRSARNERSVGLGVMGLHSYFQSKMIPMDGGIAAEYNRGIFYDIQRLVEQADKEIMKLRGPCPDSAGTGFECRFSNKTAIAPTASISIICGGSSPGIEPTMSNAFTHKTLSGSFSVKNKHLTRLLEAKGGNNASVWTSIFANEGSVQHLDLLSDEEKAVFKTAYELDQMSLVEMNAVRQQYVDQAISFNVFLPGDVDKGYLHKLHYWGWKQGLKSFYYCRSRSVGRAETVSQKVERQVIAEFEECEVCQ